MPAEKPPPARVLPPPPNRVLTLAELPVELREALPPLSIRGYVHSDDPTSRLVVVNDRMFREGDEVAADLKLERIDPDGIVLNFRGYRFVAPR
jgi:general secretion pathway protein B